VRDVISVSVIGVPFTVATTDAAYVGIDIIIDKNTNIFFIVSCPLLFNIFDHQYSFQNGIGKYNRRRSASGLPQLPRNAPQGQKSSYNRRIEKVNKTLVTKKAVRRMGSLFFIINMENTLFSLLS
jgi:hypothetical protein